MKKHDKLMLISILIIILVAVLETQCSSQSEKLILSPEVN